jgi:hypothetical protein
MTMMILMKLRIVALSSAVALSALGSLGGCTIYTYDNKPANVAPAPPHTQPQPAQPTPAKSRGPRGAIRFKARPVAGDPPATQPPPTEQPPPAAGEGKLIVAVVDGSCSISVDGQDMGMKSSLDTTVAAGSHKVGCAPAQGQAQELTVEVKNKYNTSVAFSLADPSKSTYVVTPQGAPLPPVSRPDGKAPNR